MRRVRRSNTPAEIAVRRALFGLGARFRVNVKSLPGSPDIANKKRRKAIFVHGCFWHRHDGCLKTTLPKRNREFWLSKFENNRARDERKLAELKHLGFSVLTVWECETEDVSRLTRRLWRFWFRNESDGTLGDSVNHVNHHRDHLAAMPTVLKIPSERFLLSSDGSRIVRTLRLPTEKSISSRIYAKTTASDRTDLAADFDKCWLQADSSPPYRRREHSREIRVADLFSGCGGMTLGVAEGCRALGLHCTPVIAFDVNEPSLEIYRNNFSSAQIESSPIQDIFDSPLGSSLSATERQIKRRMGRIDLLVGGPPCQGHSNLNNKTRGADPKNWLMTRVARCVEVIKPTHVIIENVPGAVNDQGGVVAQTVEALRNAGYEVDHDPVDLNAIGVPQTRKRFVIVASNKPVHLGEMVESFRVPTRTVAWAISDLLGVNGESGIDRPAAMAKRTRERIEYLFTNGLFDLPDPQRPPCHRDGTHRYKSIYGRLKWDLPAQTITTGFRSMGQGRFVHPEKKRTLTSHEAARLQFFPDFYDFGDYPPSYLAEMIGNAVPPKLTYVFSVCLLAPQVMGNSKRML